jgi:Cu/Ag efflux pump CusA
LDVMKSIAAPIVGGMIMSIVHVLILVPVLFS